MDTTNLKVYLPFDESTTRDLCSNTWTATGTPAIEGNALKLDGASYLQMNEPFTLGGKDFTVSCWVTMNSASDIWAVIFEFTTAKGTAQRVEVNGNASDGAINVWVNELWGIRPNFSIPSDTRFHLEIDYQHSTSTVKIFVDGVLTATVNKSLAAKTFTAITIGQGTQNTHPFTGTIDEFQIYDGVALHTENFTPPTAQDYLQLKLQLGGHAPFDFTADVERQIGFWRYYTAGDENLPVDVTRVTTVKTGLPPAKSKTGVALSFSGNAVFPVVATKELWVQFDAYWSLSDPNEYYISDGEGNLSVGSQNYDTGEQRDIHSSLAVSFNNENALSNRLMLIVNSRLATEEYYPFISPNTLHNIRLHMLSDVTNGILEVWIDGEKEYSYIGDVNHGKEFEHVYIHAADEDCPLVSNLIISNTKFGLEELFKDIPKETEISFSVVRCVETPTHVLETFSSVANTSFWLPFDYAVTENLLADFGENAEPLQWEIHNAPTIGTNGAVDKKALQLDKTSGIYTNDPNGALWFGGCNFSVDGYIRNLNTGITKGESSGNVFKITSATDGTPKLRLRVQERHTYSNNDAILLVGHTYMPWYNSMLVEALGLGTCDRLLHFEIDYIHDEQKLIGFLNGNVYFVVDDVSFERQRVNFEIGASEDRDSFIGTLDEFRLLQYTNTIIHSEDFAPPSKEYYEFVKAILRRKINFHVWHNGETLSFPLVGFDFPIPNAFAVRYDGKNWYNELKLPTDENAGAVHVWHDGKEYALST